MIDLLLDTSGYSLLVGAHEQAVGSVHGATSVCFSPIALAELYAGYRRGAREQQNRQQLAAFLRTPGAWIASITRTTADHYAALWHDLRAAGAPVPTNDLWIAASALEHDLTLLTADRHFERVPGLKLELLEL